MMVTFSFRPEKRMELEHFADKSRSHYAQYVADVLQPLGVTEQTWYYYRPRSSAPPNVGPKLVIHFVPNDAGVWSKFLELAEQPSAAQVVQDAVRTLPAGTASGPDFRPVWPGKDVYEDPVTIFSYP